MSDIEQIFNVQVSRETTAVTQAGFGVMMFLDLHKRFNERSKTYTSLADMVVDGFEATDAAHIAASSYFGQPVSPTKIVIGRQSAADAATLTYSAATAIGEVFTITIDDGTGTGNQVFTHTSGGAESAIVVAAAMNTEILLGSRTSVVHTDGVDGTATLTPDNALAPYTVTGLKGITIALTTSETLTVALNAIDQDSDFYGVAVYTHLEEDILEVSSFAEANKKIYGYSTSNATDKTATATSIMGQLKALSLDRSFGMWDEEAGVSATDVTEYPEAAWIGNRFPSAPGSSTWMFKTLKTISVDSLSTTESGFIRGHNGNTYETIGGVNITREGKMASGEFIDVIRGVDWLEARMEERIFSRLANLPKIPFTNAGIAILEVEVRAQLQEAVEAGVLDGEQAIIVVVPKISSISVNDRANRILPAITFEAKLAGAVHAGTVKGVVTV